MNTRISSLIDKEFWDPLMLTRKASLSKTQTARVNSNHMNNPSLAFRLIKTCSLKVLVVARWDQSRLSPSLVKWSQSPTSPMEIFAVEVPMWTPASTNSHRCSQAREPILLIIWTRVQQAAYHKFTPWWMRIRVKDIHLYIRSMMQHEYTLIQSIRRTFSYMVMLKRSNNN